MTREEFEHLVVHTGPEVFAFCLQLTRSREEAEELYQETMLAATERQRKIDAAGNPKSWLLGIAAGLWKNRRRKLARRGRICPQTTLDEQLEEVYPASGGQYRRMSLWRRLQGASACGSSAGLSRSFRKSCGFRFICTIPESCRSKESHPRCIFPQGQSRAGFTGPERF